MTLFQQYQKWWQYIGRKSNNGKSKFFFFFSSTRFYQILLTRAQALWVPKCQSSLGVLKWPWSIRVPNLCSIAQGSLECLRSALWVPNFLISVLRVKYVWKVRRNGLLNTFIEFLSIFQSTCFYIWFVLLWK